MTNASIKNTFSVLSVLALSLALSMGAFAIVAHAQADGSYDPYAGSYDPSAGSYDPYAGSYDPYAGSSASYDPYAGSYDPYAGSYDPYAGSYDPYAGSYDPYAGSYDPYAGSYIADCGCYSETVDGVVYSNNSSPNYTPSYSQPSYSQPFSFSAPGFSAYPVSIAHPTPIAQPTPVAQPRVIAQSTPIVQPININNVNTNTNTNVNTAPVTPVYQTPVTYPVQYVYPQTYPSYNYPTYQQRPYCTISISNYGGSNYGTYGNRLATLTWSSSYGTSAYISPNIGAVAPYGSMTVYPTYSTIYTMTVYGQGGTATCQTTNYNYVTPPTVSLSQIPYTGFDFGTFGNSLYWFSLIAFAAAGAYLLLYFKGGALALAGAMIPVRTSRKTEIAQATAPAVASVGTVAAPVEDPMQNLPVVSSYIGTMDTMVLARSKGKDAPRIVITRT